MSTSRLGSLRRARALFLLLVSSASFAAGAEFLRARGVPSNGTRRIVILGSSTAQGDGASLYSRSWAAQLARAVAPMGFEVVNSSIGGTSTGNSLARFQHDVVPLAPDFVVLATSLWNEGFAANPGPSYNAYSKNTRTLIGMVEAIGAVPILYGIYPNDSSTPQHVAMIKSLYAELESYRLPLWDLWDGFADDAGRWLPGLSSDGTHPVDIGHQSMFQAVPISMFPAAYANTGSPEGRVVRGVWTSPSGTGEIAVDVPSPLSSWSIGARITAPPGAGLALSMGGNLGVQLLRTAAGLELYAGGRLYASASVPAGAQTTDVLISYRAYPNWLNLYVDGAQAAVTKPSAEAGATVARWHNGCAACSFSNLVLYRAGLGPDDAAALHAGAAPRKSIEFWTSLTSPEGALNEAFTTTTARVLGDWMFSPSVAIPARGRAARP